jgi:hypothetical protein
MKTAIAVVGLCVAVTGHGFCQSNAPIFRFAVAAFGAITLSGGGVVDGFDSRVGGYNTSTNRNASGNIATDSTANPAVNVGTTHVYGYVNTGGGGTVSVTSGAVGDVAWNASHTGIEPGWTNNTMNNAFPPTAPPTGGPFSAPTVTVVGGSNITYLATGTYQTNHFTSSTSTKPMIVTGNAILWVTGDVTVSGSGYIYVQPGASLKLYVGGNATVSGVGVVNGTGLASNFSLVGLNSNTQIIDSGSAAFIGTINAPQADVTISSLAGFYGAVIANSVNIYGGFHYDESLGPTLARIFSQPSNQAVPLGSNATFIVFAEGPAPLWYQWFFNQTNLLASGTNCSSLSLTDVQISDAGNYSVIVSTSYGSVTSSNATLTVIFPPTLALQLLAGYPLLHLNGMLRSNFVVEYSTNLADTNWIILLSVTNLVAYPYPFLDPAGVVPPARFYRAFMQ